MTLSSVSELNEALLKNPFYSALGICVKEADEQNATLTVQLPCAETFPKDGEPSQYEGGPIGSLIEIAGALSVAWQLHSFIPPVNFRIEHFEIGGGSNLLAVAHTQKLSKTVALCEINVFSEDGKRLAAGKGCYASRDG